MLNPKRNIHQCAQSINSRLPFGVKQTRTNGHFLDEIELTTSWFKTPIKSLTKHSSMTKKILIDPLFNLIYDLKSSHKNKSYKAELRFSIEGDTFRILEKAVGTTSYID